MIKLFNSLEDLNNAFQQTALRRLRIGEKVFCLVKNGDEYHLLDGLCPHQKQPLHEGKLNAFGEIICPLHFYRFNLKTGKEAYNLCGDLNVYPISIKNDGVFASIRV